MVFLSFKNNGKFFLTVCTMAVILFLSMEAGQSAGRRETQTNFSLNQVKDIQKGLDNFYKDQDRFPTISEFERAQTMGSYFSPMPLFQLSSKECSKTFVYSRTSLGSYKLNFCLAESKDGYKAGWNMSAKDNF